MMLIGIKVIKRALAIYDSGAGPHMRWFRNRNTFVLASGRIIIHRNFLGGIVVARVTSR